MTNLTLLSLLFFSLAAVPTVVNAQLAANAKVWASGLNGPRGLKFGADGFLYVAEAGTGGTNTTVGTCPQVPAPVGPYHAGNTGRISKFDKNGNRTTVATGLPSAQSSLPTGDTMGVSDIAFLDGALYAVTAGGGCGHGNSSLPNGIYKINRTTGAASLFANLSVFVQQHSAKYVDASDFEPDGVFYSLIAYAGKLYTVEPNHGQIFSIDRRGNMDEILDVSASQGHIVPTSIVERGGAFYLGNLGLFPIIPESSRIMTVSRFDSFRGFVPGLDEDCGEFNIVRSKAGFTTIVGLAFGPDGLIYALELSDASGNPSPGAGKVVRVQRSGDIEEVATGLTVPTAMTFGPDGKLYVSNQGAVPGAGAGQIVQIDIP